MRIVDVRALKPARRWIALAPCALAVGCALGTTPDPTAQTGQAVDALPDCPYDVNCSFVTSAATSSDLKQVATVASDLLTAIGDGFGVDNPGQFNSFKSVGNGFKVGGDLVKALIDAFSSQEDVGRLVSCGTNELACLLVGSAKKTDDVTWATEEYSPVESAYQDAVNFASNPTLAAVEYSAAHSATLSSGQEAMFERTYLPSLTNGDGAWKSIIDDATPPIVEGPNLQFDWEVGFPRFLSLLPKQLIVLAAFDPEFIEKGSYNAQLEGTTGDPGYRVLLQQLLQQMLGGIRCAVKERDSVIVIDVPNGGDGMTASIPQASYDHTDIACADVNTGISQEYWYYRPDGTTCDVAEQTDLDVGCLDGLPSQNTVWNYEDLAYRAVVSKMPVFEAQAMIDVLRRLTHPWVPDLTQGAGRIPVNADTSLCLDVQWGNPTSGTPVQIWGCNGTGAQQWAYSRSAQTITNTAFGKCLQVRLDADPSDPSSHQEGRLVEISDCVNPVPPQQQWTYDPENGVIQSALGTVLDIQWGVIQEGTPVQVWDRNGTAAQSWYPDRNGSYCDDNCQPLCWDECAGDGPGTGSCVGGCMGGCVGSCNVTDMP
jgi:hypothetical protein